MQLFFVKSALAALRKLTPIIQRSILDKLRFYIAQKNILKFAEPLTGSESGRWRFRIGDYRVIFKIIKDKIVILKIGHRKDVYR